MKKKPVKNYLLVPRALRKELRDKEIRSLYKNGKGLSMDQITQKGYSKMTIFRAVHKGRRKKTSTSTKANARNVKV